MKIKIIKTGLIILAVLIGGWMIFDGAHVILTGKYFGPDQPGPWADLIRSIGVDPYDLGAIFVVLGLCWIFGIIGLTLKKPWAFELSIAISIASLWYIPFGTIIALIFLLALIKYKDDIYKIKGITKS